jgi:hypothetical protein
MDIPFFPICKMSILGALAKLRKAAFSFAMSVCPFVRPSVNMEKLDSHWTDFHKIRYFGSFFF